ncbi:MAG: DUF4127 family protein [Candidatus Lustribacter sp.]
MPLDDRPVTLQLPKMLGAIAGVRVATPPRPLLGNYLEPGDPAALLHWLHDEAPRDASAYIVSTDMLDFGGLVASRAPGTPPYVAETRLRDLAAFRAQRPAAAFALFGTVMRLAPTGVPALGAAADFFAAGQPVDWLTQYANLPDPPQTPEQKALAAKLAGQLGGDLPAYLATRARDRDVDLYALQLTAENAFDRIVIGQDDAGPVGLHLRDLAALHSFARRWLPPGRADIEPGADELGMILTGAELAREAHVVPRVRVRYSRAGGGSVQDPLEFAPVDTTIGDIIRACGAVRAPDGDAHADIDLFVRVPGTSAADESAFVDAIAAETADGANGPRPAVADLTFLDAGDLDEQRALVEAMIARGIAGKIDAFASWNTTANTIGTAIPAAIATLVGHATHGYDPVMHAQFMLDRYADDYAFHDFVRPAVNDDLSQAGIDDHTYLLPAAASFAASQNRADLWPRALTLLSSIYPLYRDMGLTITLPWDRTFETELDVRLSSRASSRDSLNQ